MAPPSINRNYKIHFILRAIRDMPTFRWNCKYFGF